MTTIKRGRVEWVALVQEYKSSGLTHQEFAEKHKITTHALGYWCVKLRKEERSASSTKFLPVQVVACGPKGRQVEYPEFLEAVLRSGLLVRFVAGTDTRYLAELFSALG